MDIQGGRSLPKWRWIYWTAAVLILLLPLVAMQFTHEVAWDLFDFAAAAVLLGAAGLAYEMACRVTPSTFYRSVVGVALAALLFLTWLELAAGIL